MCRLPFFDRWFAWARVACIAATVAGASGCATIPPGAGENPADRLEVYNRHVFEFNEKADEYVLRPVAQAYVNVVPEGMRICVSNVFSNIADVGNALNNLLQGKPANAVSDLCRVAINSTVGLLGCFDVASKMGLAKSTEDFGQTLGYWGVGPYSYFVIPLLGPSTVRDAFGRVVDVYSDPLSYAQEAQVAGQTLRIVDTRASLLQASRVLEGSGLDRYQFVRDAYLQRRRNLIHDGAAPSEKLPVYEDYEDPEEDDKQPEKGRTEKPEKGDSDQPPATEKR
ncbi:MAG TPA: VacJ family lipoprotein [Burkholderiaceae bacterium]|nr:VacJ family lipoprotein [Burkholderiaceae bacterium]